MLFLIVVYLFDDQRTTSYSLVVRALSVAGVEASTTLTVQVGDVNDSPPVLRRVRYGRSTRAGRPRLDIAPLSLCPVV